MKVLYYSTRHGYLLWLFAGAIHLGEWRNIEVWGYIGSFFTLSYAAKLRRILLSYLG
jgi:hypothetical protein